MNDPQKHLQNASLVMKIVGWLCVVALPLSASLYAPGVLWGQVLAGHEHFPIIGPAHPPSPFDGLHPYFYMLAVMYITYGLVMLRGASKPLRNVALFDYGILANVVHGGIMIPQAFYYPNEHAHLWFDIPFAFLVVFLLIKWHPKKVETQVAA